MLFSTKFNLGHLCDSKSSFLRHRLSPHELPKMLKYLGLVKTDDYIVITAGIPIKKMSPTNMIKINKIN